MPPARTVVMALQFPPRGGSAQVVRYLAPEITAAGWSVSLVTGSLGGPGELGYAPEFFAPLPVTPVDYTPAMDTWAMGGDPLAGPRPLHPSFEDRAGAPDPVFATLDDAAFERQVACWSTALVDGGIGAAGVAHLHHLTPINEAVARVRPDLPVVVSLHGTEMNMLEAITARRPGGGVLGPSGGLVRAAAGLGGASGPARGGLPHGRHQGAGPLRRPRRPAGRRGPRGRPRPVPTAAPHGRRTAGGPAPGARRRPARVGRVRGRRLGALHTRGPGRVRGPGAAGADLRRAVHPPETPAAAAPRLRPGPARARAARPVAGVGRVPR